MRLKIGEFARLGQVSIQTLRYYDELDLLKPSEVDRFSSYRYYDLEQLPRLLKILALKDMGMSLDQISLLLREDLSCGELQRILKLKQGELETRVQEDLERLERINARLRLLERQDYMLDYEVIIKQVAVMKVVSVRRCVPSYWEVTALWNDLLAKMQAYHLNLEEPYLTLCHGVEPQIDLEVCMPVADDCPPALHPQTLPAVEAMACTIHHGAFTGLISGFTALIGWVDANGYTIAGPDREIYHRMPQPGQYDSDPQAVTELQIPVVKMS